jgi:2,4-dienoyl-CoA reductase (NADPH2)
MDRLKANGINMLTDAHADEITSQGVQLTLDQKSRFIPADTVVLAAGAVAHNSLLQKLQARFDNIHPVGDCLKPQKVRQAVESGYKIAMEI